MLIIYREMIKGFRHLFPRGKFRFVLVALSLIAASISVSELLVMKLFATLILNEDEFDRKILGWAVAGFFLFFLITRLGQFYQRNYRVTALARSFRAVKKEKSLKQENREWSMAFELTNIISLGVQLVAILGFFFILNPLIAVINVLILLIVLQLIGSIFRKQLAAQAELSRGDKTKKVKPGKRYGMRIRAAETGALLSGGATMVLLAALIFLSISGEITPANTLVIFLGARLQNSVISNGSRSLMRYAKSNSRVTADDDNE